MTETSKGSERTSDRLSPVRDTLLAAINRSQEMGKIMVDPMDVLIYVIEDPAVKDELTGIGIDVDQITVQIERIDEQVPQGEAARAFERFTEIDQGLYLSYVLRLSIAKAKEVADEENAFGVTAQHLLAGMIRQGFNSGVEVFREIGITQEQYATLARIK